MYSVILSGGSGTRLWPLSVASRAKQFIPIFASPDTDRPLSMLQLAWRGLASAGLEQRCLICAGENQLTEMHQQLPGAQVVTEPFSHDTFAAIALTCTYIYSVLDRPLEEIVCFIPVDTCAGPAYYQLISRLPGYLEDSGAEVVLMGIKPDSASSSYGYLVPQSPVLSPAEQAGDMSRGKSASGWQPVLRFVEKPDQDLAADLLAAGALWNAGVFCFKLQFMLNLLQDRALPGSYTSLRTLYAQLPRQSFDYEVLQYQPALAVAPYTGTWTDTGSWQSVRTYYRKAQELTAEEMVESVNTDSDKGPEPALVINQTHIPVIVNHLHDLLLIASYDGIYLSDNPDDSKLKECVRQLPHRPTFIQASWGSSTVIYTSQAAPTAHIQAGKVSWDHHRPQADHPDLSTGGYALRLLKINPQQLAQTYVDSDTAITILVLTGQIQFWQDRESKLLSQGETCSFMAGQQPDLFGCRAGAELLLFQRSD
ncbi:hypothetical protein HCH52_04285 [Oscillospiraceae bacterium HV4-5-C5C]|nr:hypothetical protein [Oscillospiraceae bacterium HV4-5-C5C]